MQCMNTAMTYAKTLGIRYSKTFFVLKFFKWDVQWV